MFHSSRKRGSAYRAELDVSGHRCFSKESRVFEKPDVHKSSPFVENLLQTPGGVVPQVKTKLGPADMWGGVRVRLGIHRNDYRVEPGLYAVGSPSSDSPVLVTANFKLTFDHVRRELAGLHVWLLVLDTHGINVWCAAGKKSFSSAELCSRIEGCGLANLVSHRQLILPQLGASGVCAHKIRDMVGFSVIWGPVRAADIPCFLKNGFKAQEKMRVVIFPLRERLALIPVEIKNVFKPSCLVLACIFILSGVGRDFFSFSAAWSRGGYAALAFVLGLLGGTLLVPALLPWVPGRKFYVKGMVAAVPLIIPVLWYFYPALHIWETVALILFCLVVSSYTAMNFTGSTPFTSPSGVGVEVRQGLLIHSLFMVCAVFLWILAGFLR